MNATRKVEGLAGVTAGETSICTVGKEGAGLTYRGYDIYDLADNASFEEVAYLLMYGKLPSQVELDVVYAADFVQVTVIDDGTGFDPSVAPDGLGLGNLEERTSELGGSFSITSAPGHGTAVAFSLPLKGA